MVSITKAPTVVVKKYEGTFTEVNLIEDENEYFEHPFVLSVSINSDDTISDLDIDWTNTTPEKLNEIEGQITHEFLTSHVDQINFPADGR
jgi:hypothetical protein